MNILVKCDSLFLLQDCQVEYSLPAMMNALRLFNWDSMDRLRRFTDILPGTKEIAPTEKNDLVSGWKWLAFWVVRRENSYLCQVVNPRSNASV